MSDLRLIGPIHRRLNSYGCSGSVCAHTLSAALTVLFALVASTASAQWPMTRPLAPQPQPPPHQALNGAPGTVVSTTPHPAVARILVPEKNGQSYGSGTLVDARGQHGLVITNWHVIRDASAEITVVFPDGFRSPAHVVKTDRDWDLAALSIWRPTVSAIPLATAAPQIGESLTIAGYGSGDYRAAIGTCTQYLAPSERHPYELVEVAAEARQGDSGGPIFNGQGELAGVLFGSGPGYTSGSYGGRVREFLATVIPTGDTPVAAGSTAIATAPPVGVDSGSNGSNVGMGGVVPPVSPLATANQGASQPMVDAGTTAAYPPAPAPLPVASAPPSPAPQPVPLIADALASRGFETEAPLTPVKENSAGGWRRRAEDDPEANPRTAVEFAPSDPPASDLVDVPFGEEGDSQSRRERGGEGPMVALKPSDSQAFNRAAMVAHTPLPPRPGLEPAAIGDAPADQLLAAAWKRVGGTTLWDQAKTVLAIVGMLTLVIQFWRFNSHSEPQHEE